MKIRNCPIAVKYKLSKTGTTWERDSVTVIQGSVKSVKFRVLVNNNPC
jgi:hypothetical protein